MGGSNDIVDMVARKPTGGEGDEKRRSNLLDRGMRRESEGKDKGSYAGSASGDE